LDGRDSTYKIIKKRVDCFYVVYNKCQETSGIDLTIQMYRYYQLKKDVCQKFKHFFLNLCSDQKSCIVFLGRDDSRVTQKTNECSKK
jgi:hypothetical protein